MSTTLSGPAELRRPYNDAKRSTAERTGGSIRVAVWLVVVLGIAVRLATYIANRSLFIDEAALALSVRDRGLLELLTRPLDYGQTAPAGFLILLELATAALKESEYSLRLPALVAGVASVPLFAVLAWQLLPATGVLIATTCFAFARPLIYYSSETKPYAFDVLSTLVVSLLAFNLWKRGVAERRAFWLGAAGVVSVWFSQPILFVMAGIGFALIVRWRRDERVIRVLAVCTALPWLLSGAAAVAAAFAVYPQTARDYMKVYWRDGFLPLQLDTPGDLMWLPRSILTFCLDPLGSPVPVLPLAAMLGGTYALARRDRVLLCFVAGPFLVTLVASALTLYPFGRMDFQVSMYSGRVVLYLVPSALLLIGWGFAALWDRSGPSGRRTTFVAAVTLVGSFAALSLYTFPYTREDGRAALEYLSTVRSPDEPVYVYFRGQHYTRFYAPRVGVDTRNFVFGSCLHEPPARFLGELNDLRRSGRMWFVVIPPDAQEQRMLLNYLGQNGVEIKRYQGRRVLTALYDFRGHGEARVPPDSLLVPHHDPDQKRLACATIYNPPPRVAKARS